jgi:hypothetical protein
VLLNSFQFHSLPFFRGSRETEQFRPRIPTCFRSRRQITLRSFAISKLHHLLKSALTILESHRSLDTAAAGADHKRPWVVIMGGDEKQIACARIRSCALSRRDVSSPDTCMRDGVLANNSTDGEIIHRMATLGLRIAQ